MKRLFLAAAAASLSACATTDGAARLAAADAALADIQARYQAARSVAALFAPWLPAVQAARVRALADAVELALAAARAATGGARRAALARADAAADAYRGAVGG
jgi:hypothetical protein